MRKKRFFMKKIISIQLVLIVILAMIINIIVINKTYAATTYKQETKQGVEAFPESYKTYLNELHDLHPNWTFTAFNTGMTWQDFISKETNSHLKNTVHNSSDALWKDSCGKVASSYACASQAIIEYYADPRNFLTESRVFQFLEMSYNPSVHTKSGVESILKNSFMDTTVDITMDNKTETMSYSDIIMKAAQESKISPYSIAIKIFQEVGRQGSSSVTGNYQGYQGYYNFFNYGAYDSGNAIENGLKYAKDKGWNNQYISIVEGAKLMANSYINVGQNTAYFYKFDVIDEGKNGVCSHQYMTNIQDPESQSKTLYNTYANNNMLNASLSFVIPVFNDMPSRCNLPSQIDQNNSSSYYITGTDVSFRSQPSTSSSKIGTFSKNEIVTVLDLNAKESDGYTWANVQRSNGTKGYVANCYLKPCNDNNNTTTTTNKNIKTQNTNVITVPNMKLSEIVKAMNLTSYTITNSSGQNVDVNSNAGTGYNIKDTKENKTYKIVVLGDANGDAYVNSGDLLAVKKHLLGTSVINDESMKSAANPNSDSVINSGDLLLIKKHLLGTQMISL